MSLSWFFWNRPGLSLLYTLGFSVSLLARHSSGADDIEAQRSAVAQQARKDPAAGLVALQALLKDHPENMPLVADTILVANWAGEDRLALHLYARHPSLQSNADAVEAAARSARNIEDRTRAVTLFRTAGKLSPKRWQPRLGLALTLAEDGQNDEAESLLEALLLEQSHNTEVLAGCAYGFRLTDKSLRAMAAYEGWLEQTPKNEGVQNGLALMLSRMRGNFRASQLPVTDPLTRIEIAVGLVAERIRWGQSYAPTRVLQKEETLAAMADIERAENLGAQLRRGLQGGERRHAQWLAQRLEYDRVVALRDLLEMQAARDAYEQLPADPDPPAYVREAAADAYLALHLPAQSEPLYQELVSEAPELATPWIGLAYSQLERENPAGALATMAEAKDRSPIWLEAPGLRIPQANPDHEMIETQEALMFSFAEDYPTAQKMMEKLRDEAPANLSIREAMARVYLARGWPDRAEEELLIAQTFEPNDDGITLAMAEVHETQGRRDESDAEIRTLMQNAPDHERMRSFLKDRDVDRGWRVTLGGTQGFGNGAQVGSQDQHEEARVETPLLDNRWRFFAKQLYSYADYSAGDANRWRVGGGVTYDYDGKGAWLGAYYQNGTTGENVVVDGGGTLALGDHWSLAAEGSSDSLDVPLQAALAGVRGYGGEASVTWRDNERRSLTLATNLTRFDDGNDRGALALTWNERLYTTPKLKLNSRFIAYGSANSKDDRTYFNPRRDLELGPWVELDWLTARSYEFEFHQYLGAYGGAYWQEDYGTGPSLSVRYGQRWQPKYGSAITWEIVYGRRPYDGGQEDRLAIAFGIEWGGK